ncbi:MAG: YgiQ family radical SAM protein [Promethearchaeota archaeon]
MILTKMPSHSGTNTSANSRKNVFQFDVILISGEYWADHPHSGVGIIARVLENAGYSVGFIEKPNWRSPNDFMKLGLPKLFFGITSGSIDSMLQNYTPLKKPRSKDPFKPYDSQIPDRAVIVYSQMVHRAINLLQSQSEKIQPKPNPDQNHIPIILGGVEASLRRFTHYDYWDNKLRRPILFDAKADILVYGPGENQIVEIANRIVNNKFLIGINGTSVILEEKHITEFTEPKEFLPSFNEVKQSKEAFCDMQLAFSNQNTLIQQVDHRYIVQFQQHFYTTEELDAVYRLPFSYDVPENFPEFKMAQFSIITHRGCIGECSFCAIALHQGTKIVSRSQQNILDEITKMTRHPEFTGYIGDLGGPSANMYGMDCDNASFCPKKCMTCSILDQSHRKPVDLLQAARKIPGVKKVFVRSGIRYDMVVDRDEYLQEISDHHISGSLKIAPEHFSPTVCALMNKDSSSFEKFRKKFLKMNASKNQTLKYYFITAHPGSTMEDAVFLKQKIAQLGEKSTESIQIFTPTPMSDSTCMYYTGLNPFTKEPIHVPYSYREKKEQKNILYKKDSQDPKKPSQTSRSKNKSSRSKNKSSRKTSIIRAKPPSKRDSN